MVNQSKAACVRLQDVWMIPIDHQLLHRESLNTWNFYPNLMYPSVEICLLIWENAAAFNQTIVWELPRQKTCVCPFYIFLHVSFLFANEQKLQYHSEGPRRTTSKSTRASEMMSNAWFHYFTFFPTTAQRSAFKSTPIEPSLLSNQLGLHVPKATVCLVTLRDFRA